MNILFLTAWYPVENTPHKGLFVQEHARAIAEAGHNVTVVVLDVSRGNSLYRTSSKKFKDAHGFDIHVISIHSRFYKKLYALYPWLSRKVKNYVKQNVLNSFTPGVVHSNVLYPAGLIGAEISSALDIPHVITEHWSKAIRFLEKNFFRIKGKNAYASAGAVTCVSTFLKNQLNNYFTATSRIEIIPNVVRTEHFGFAGKTSRGKVVFSAVATWMLPKRPDLFIDALGKIAASHSNREFELHLFGEGPQLGYIRLSNYPANFKIVYRGFCAKQEIGEQFRQSDFMLHASEIETFSIVVAEALSTGTPVVASNCGALPELLSPKNGVLSENTPDAWENAILTAMNTKYDHSEISAEVKERYTSAKIGESFSKLYGRIVTQPKS
jgi:glycosyltransferase involved in cell wall biosynthesis